MDKSSTTCKGCYWENNCGYSSPCSYYDPIGIEDNDEVIEQFIELERAKYRKEWYKYIKDFD